MNERDLLYAPKTHALLNALRAARIDVNPGTSLHIALMEFAHVEATKAAELAREFQRTAPITIELKTSEEARHVIESVHSAEKEEIARLRRGLEGAKDWAARSGVAGLEQWCSEALSPTGRLAVFPPAAPVSDLRDATIKALADALMHALTPGVPLAEAIERSTAALRLAGR